MAFPVFDPPTDPDYGLGDDTKFDVKIARFGDGYSQRSRAGLNSTRSTFNLTWSDIDNSDAAVIHQWLKATNGTSVFWWTPPPEYPTDLPSPVTDTITGITVGGSALSVRSPTQASSQGPMLFRCASLKRVRTGPLTTTITATLEQEFDLET